MLSGRGYRWRVIRSPRFGDFDGLNPPSRSGSHGATPDS